MTSVIETFIEKLSIKATKLKTLYLLFSDNKEHQNK